MSNNLSDGSSLTRPIYGPPEHELSDSTALSNEGPTEANLPVLSYQWWKNVCLIELLCHAKELNSQHSLNLRIIRGSTHVRFKGLFSMVF